MTDVDMEPDTSWSLGQLDQSNEDLIDYDTDMPDHGSGWATGEGVGKYDDHTLASGDKEHIQEGSKNIEDHDSPEQVTKRGDIEDSTRNHSVPSLDDATHPHSPEFAATTTTNEAPGAEEDDYVEIFENEPGHGSSTGGDEHASEHEIDYEHDTVEQETLQDEFDADVGGNPPNGQTELIGDDVGNKDIIPLDSTTADGSGPDYTAEAVATGHDADTWDVLEEHNLNEAEERTAGTDTTESAEKQVSENDEEAEGTQDQHEKADESGEPTSEQLENMNNGPVVDEHTAIREDYGEELEADGSQEEEQSNVDDDEPSTRPPDPSFPPITVQYRGDEFPFFSTTTQGFFVEDSCLDDTLDTLLAKLREELSSEIADQDELVFQVDELGLEFSESSSYESLSSVSLRQIVEIFDLLVKNQDPDSSRTLYTYLFTKPSASKRLESLIESATAGKGLDEVIHLFESPMPTRGAALDATSAARGLDEHLDAYESPFDDTVESDYLDEKQESLDEDHDDQQLGPSDAEAGQYDDQNEAEIHDDEDHEPEQPDAEESTESNEYAPDDIGLLEHNELDAPAEKESNAFMNFELDDSIEVGAEDAALGQLDVTDDFDAPEPDTTNLATAATSTTNTLRGDDDDTAPIMADLDGQSPGEDPANTTTTGPADDDDLAEIDWRDDPEASHEAYTSPSGIGKRARTDDDELGAEDEKDVKRRRP